MSREMRAVQVCVEPDASKSVNARLFQNRGLDEEERRLPPNVDGADLRARIEAMQPRERDPRDTRCAVWAAPTALEKGRLVAGGAISLLTDDVVHEHLSV
ncbi:MAG: hypothetical protein GEU82_07240 [Luteitalea sp.]|nr:hypothetical protein [Luteitalea sp.]